MRTNDLYLVAAAASMMMFAACTHDDGTLSTASPASNEIVITTRSSDIGFTRAESDIQSTQFLNGEHIDIFLRDASGVADSTTYGNPYNYQTNGSGGGILTRDGSTVVKDGQKGKRVVQTKILIKVKIKLTTKILDTISL